MPWKIVENDSGCSSSKPWGVRKESNGELEGCHPTKAKAQRQVAALNAAEDKGAAIREAVLQANAEESMVGPFRALLAGTLAAAADAEFVADITEAWNLGVDDLLEEVTKQAAVMAEVSGVNNGLDVDTVPSDAIESIVSEHLGGVARYAQLLEATIFRAQVADPEVSFSDALAKVLAPERAERLASGLVVHLRNGVEYVMLNLAASSVLTAAAASDPFSRRKAWITMRDDRVRPAHRNAHGQVTPVAGVFIVGGYSCRYPGDPALPAALRINCRCVTVRADDLDVSNQAQVLDVVQGMIARRQEKLAAARRLREAHKAMEAAEEVGVSSDTAVDLIAEKAASSPDGGSIIAEVIEASPEAAEALSGAGASGLIEALKNNPSTALLVAFLLGLFNEEDEPVELSTQGVPMSQGDCGCGCKGAGTCGETLVVEQPAQFVTAGPDHGDGVMVCVRPTEEQTSQIVLDGGLPPEDIHCTLAYFGTTEELDGGAQDQLQEIIREVAATSEAISGEISGVAVFEANEQRPLVGLVDAPGLSALRDQLMRSSEAAMGDGRGPKTNHDFQPHITLGYEASEDGADEDSVRDRAGVPLTFEFIELVFGEEVSRARLGCDGSVEDCQEMTMTDTATETLADEEGVELAEALDEVVLDEPTEAALAETVMEAEVLTGNAARAAANDYDWTGVLVVEGIESGDRRRIIEGALTWRDLPVALMLQTDNPETGGHAGATIAGSIWKIERVGNEIVGWGFFDSGEAGIEARRLLEEGTMRGVSVDLDMVSADIEIDELSDDPNPRLVLIEARIMGATITPFPAFQEARLEVISTALVAAACAYLGFGFDSDGSEIKLWRTNIPFNVTIDPVNDPLVADGTVRSISSQLCAPLQPPREWFDNQPAMDCYYGVEIEDDGRVHGYVTDWITCHIGFMDRCVTAPRNFTNYNRFRQGPGIRCSDGSKVKTGVVYVGVGHADLTLNAAQAMEAMSNSGNVVADVVPYDTPHGIYIAGSLRPDASPLHVRAFQGAKISPDWRPLDGRSELVGMVVVNTSGFVPAALVASAVANGITIPADGHPHVRWDFETDQPLAMVAVGIPQDHDLDPIERLAADIAEIKDFLIPLRVAAAREKIENARSYTVPTIEERIMAARARMAASSR